MDKKKQPGINCESIILAESVFRRIAVIPEDNQFNINFSVKNIIDEKNFRAYCEVTATINHDNDPVYAKIVYIGIFSGSDGSNMDMKQFIANNAPAIIFPYIREEIHSRTMKAGLPKMLVIQPVNILALTKNNIRKTGKKKDE